MTLRPRPSHRDDPVLRETPRRPRLRCASNHGPRGEAGGGTDATTSETSPERGEAGHRVGPKRYRGPSLGERSLTFLARRLARKISPGHFGGGGGVRRGNREKVGFLRRGPRQPRFGARRDARALPLPRRRRDRGAVTSS